MNLENVRVQIKADVRHFEKMLKISKLKLTNHDLKMRIEAMSKALELAKQSMLSMASISPFSSSDLELSNVRARHNEALRLIRDIQSFENEE